MKKIVLLVILIIISIVTAVSLTNRNVCRNFLDLYQNREYSKKGLSNAINYDPDKGRPPLPELDQKDFFEAVDDWSICRHESVRKYLYIYLTRDRNYIINAISRSYSFEETINKEFKNFTDIPEDILLLPLLESGFNPYAVSRTNAVGLWQFIQSTSGILGLKNDYWIDERKDIKKSTKAALTHLKNIHTYFNSWDLALAAYNGGSFHVLQSMRYAKTKNYWELRKSGYLREETSEFVPKLAALIIIYKYQNLFGIDKEITPKRKTVSKTIAVSNSIDLKKLSIMTGTPVEKLRSMNPELNRDMTPPYKNYSFRIPLEALYKLEENVNNPLIIRYVNL